MTGISRSLMVGLAVVWTQPFCVAAASVPAETLNNPPASSSTLLTDAPASAQPIAAALRRAIDLADAARGVQLRLGELRGEHLGVQEKLKMVTGEQERMEQERQQLLRVTEERKKERQTRLTAARTEQDARIKEDLTRLAKQTTEQQERDKAQQLQLLDAKQQDALRRKIAREIEPDARELERMSREIDREASQLLSRLEQLQISDEVGKVVSRSTNDALAKRRAQLDARRDGLIQQHERAANEERARFTEQLTRQHRLEQERLVTLEEASLRSQMAARLQAITQEEDGRLNLACQSVEDIQQRQKEMVQQQALQRSRIANLDEQMAALERRGKELANEQRPVRANLEQLCSQPALYADASLRTWFNQVIQTLPTEQVGGFEPLQQRMAALAEEAQRNDQEARSRKTEELMARAEKLARRGRLEDALKALEEARAINPSQTDEVSVAREQLLARKEQQVRQQRMAELEQMFARAVKEFEQERYAQAIVLFEQVIAQEQAFAPSSRQIE